MISTGGFFHIQLSTYHRALVPFTHAWMVSVDMINFFVGFAGATDSAKAHSGLTTIDPKCKVLWSAKNFPHKDDLRIYIKLSGN
jgi:hypothetical protein